MESPDAVGMASLHGQAPYVTVFLKMAQDVVERATFQAFGCGVTIACCSALTELVSGRTMAQCRALSAGDVVQALDGVPPDKQFCAELVVRALRQALDDWERKRSGQEQSSDDTEH
jgi:NifU-like protein involved in Fe-S cluster formation